MLTRRAILAGAAAFAGTSWAQTPLRGADIAGDIALLRDAYETLHPGLYRYATQAETNARFDALADAWSRDQSLGDAFLTLSRFLATIRCGHTHANFYNQSDAVIESLFAGRTRPPFHFAWLERRMVVLRNFSGDARLDPGAEILSINGRTAPHLLADLLPYMRADGGNDAKRVSLLEVRGGDRFESFDIFHGLRHPDAARGLTLRVRPARSGQAISIDVAPIDLATRQAAMADANAGDDAPAWRLDYPATNVARLTMPGWALYNSTWDWRAFLDAGFEEIASQGVRRLIIDLRGNEGGLDACGHATIGHLIDAPLTLSGYERRVRYQRVPDRLNPHLDTWDDSFRDWGDIVEPAEDGFYRPRSAEDGQVVIAPRGPRFTGDVAVLIGPANSSATFQFATIVRERRLGTLIGQPTGGNLRGINGGAFFFLRLPASGLECDLPLIGFFARTPMPDSGVAPDVFAPETADDIAAGRDAAMARALGL
ncbi:MAG: peptidase S41 [Alphaproteobacteria bacterium]|nr:peptidase S41 [Alphaproteobacteria bacterium]